MTTDHYARHLGITVQNFGAGPATATLRGGPEHLNPHGTAHGALMVSVVSLHLSSNLKCHRIHILITAAILYLCP